MPELDLQPVDGACGAIVTGLDLTAPLSEHCVAQLRSHWLQWQVLVFPDQAMDDNDLERFSRYFGEFGLDPFFEPIADHPHVCEISRRADEKAPLFAENWHTDWSFQAVPPAATCLLGLTIPPSGGDTDFINQQQALQAMPPALRRKLEGRQAIHSARTAYAPSGIYGKREKGSDRSMKIRYSEEALATQPHPLIRPHPETGAETLFGCLGYIVGIEGMAEVDAVDLLLELHAWQTREEFQYRHRWQANMLVMWDNRSVLHKANGGYKGYDRILHRTTIADRSAGQSQ